MWLQECEVTRRRRRQKGKRLYIKSFFKDLGATLPGSERKGIQNHESETCRNKSVTCTIATLLLYATIASCTAEYRRARPARPRRCGSETLFSVAAGSSSPMTLVRACPARPAGQTSVSIFAKSVKGIGTSAIRYYHKSRDIMII